MCLVASALTLKIKKNGITILVAKKKGTRKLTSPNLNDNVNGRTNKNVKMEVVFIGSMPSR